jgi:hypothetical protein
MASQKQQVAAGGVAAVPAVVIWRLQMGGVMSMTATREQTATT